MLGHQTVSDSLGDTALSRDELTAAVKAIQACLESTAKAVEWNCELLNALVTRTNTIEAISSTTVTAFEASVARTDPKLKELDGFGTSIAKAPDKCNDMAKIADTNLRHELNKVTGMIDKDFSDLEEKVRILSTTAMPPLISQGNAASVDQPVQSHLYELDRRIGECVRTAEGLNTRVGAVEVI